MKKFLVFIILFVLFNISVSATSLRFLSGGDHILSDSYKMQVLIENPGDSGRFNITYNPNDFSFSSSQVQANSNQYSITNNGNSILIDFTYSASNGSDIITLYFNVKKTTPFTANFTITPIKNNQPTNTMEVEVPFRYANTNANLSSLTVKEGTNLIPLSPSFNSNVTSYSLTTYAKKIIVSAEKEDKHAKVTGTGYQSLNVGKNTINVVVTAEDGTPRTYTITATRLPQSSDSSLKELKVNNQIIELKNNQAHYDVTVDSADSTISAIANDSKATISYPSGQSVSLNPGSSKELKIKVTAEDKTYTTYYINISRKASNSGLNTNTNTNTNTNSTKPSTNTNTTTPSPNTSSTKPSTNVTTNPSTNKSNSSSNSSNNNNQNTTINPNNNNTSKQVVTDSKKDSNNYIKSLKISNVDFKFDKNTLEYSLNVISDIKQVDFQVTLESKKATYEIVGNNDLSEGKNEFAINVIAENGDIRQYKVTILRNKELVDAENTEEDILKTLNNLTNADIMYVQLNSVDEKVVLTPNILKLLKSKNKSIVIYYVDNGTIDYQFVITSDDIVSEEETTLFMTYNKLDDNISKLLDYSDYYSYEINTIGNSLKRTELKLYLSNKINDINNFDLLLFSDDKLNNITDKNIEDGYLSYVIDDFNKAIIVANPVEKPKESVTITPNKKEKNYIPFIVGGGVVIAISSGTIIILKKKKKVINDPNLLNNNTN